MSWSRRSSTPPPPRAFMGSNENSCIHALRLMAKEQRYMAVRHLTVEDLRQAFVPEGYRHSLQEAFRVASPQYVSQEMAITLPRVEGYPDEYPVPIPQSPLVATFSWNRDKCPDGFFTPKEIEPTLQPDVSSELKDKIEYAFARLMQSSFEMGMVEYVFRALNVNGYCNTPPQMRYVWPAIRHIVGRVPNLKELEMTLVDASARAGDKARVPGPIKPFLIPTVDIINRTTLMDKIEMPDREFSLAVNAAGFNHELEGCVAAFHSLT